MKDSESCTLHTEEGTSSQSLPRCAGLSNIDRCRYAFRNTHTFYGWHIRWKTALHVKWALFTSSQPPKPKLLYTLEELPVIILTIYYSTSPLTQFWFDGGFPDSPELSKNLDTITLALGSSTSSALCSVNITLWCVYLCQILIPTFAARETFHPPSLRLWLSHIFCNVMTDMFSLPSFLYWPRIPEVTII